MMEPPSKPLPAFFLTIRAGAFEANPTFFLPLPCINVPIRAGACFDGDLATPTFLTLPSTKIPFRAGARFDADPAFDADAVADPLDPDPAFDADAIADLDDTATFDDARFPRTAFPLSLPRTNGSDAFLFVPCADGLDRLDGADISADLAGARRVFIFCSACLDGGMILLW